jgi:hypothetical protein
MARLFVSILDEEKGKFLEMNSDKTSTRSIWAADVVRDVKDVRDLISG